MDPLTVLACRARQGDERAVASLVEAAYDPVWRLCAALVDRDSADDLAQDAMMRAVRALPGYRAEAPARTWMLAVARHTCLDELRTRTRRRRAAAEAPPAAPTPDHGDEVASADLLTHLDADRRTAFALTQLIGLSYREAAEVCDCPIGTIRSRVARARVDLLAMLDDERLPDDHRLGGQPPVRRATS